MSFTEFYCIPGTGSNVNSGSTTSGTPAFSSTNGSWNSGTGVFTVASGTVSGVSVGDFASVYVDASTTTNFVGRVTAVGSTTITVSTSITIGSAPSTSATARSIVVGGCWAGPSGANGFPFTIGGNGGLMNTSNDPMRVNFKNNSTYSITAAITQSGSQQGWTWFEGYTTTPGDGGRAILDGGTSGASYTLLTVGLPCVLRNFIFQNNGATGSAAGIAVSTGGAMIESCVAHALRGFGFSGTATPAQFVECEAYACNQSNTSGTGGMGGRSRFVRCISHDNTGSNSCGFVASGDNTIFEYCIADSNTKDGFVQGGSFRMDLQGCVAYGNGGSGFSFVSGIVATKFRITNSLFISNGVGVTLPTGTGSSRSMALIINSGFFANTTRLTQNDCQLEEVGTVTLTSDPFVSSSAGDFRLNTAEPVNAGRGKFTQTQTSYGSAAVKGYPDLGALQHLEGAVTGVPGTQKSFVTPA